jgi:hypothetical protein
LVPIRVRRGSLVALESLVQEFERGLIFAVFGAQAAA